MATTSLWRIKGTFSNVIDYIENPDKTYPSVKGSGGADASIETVMNYVTRDSATDHSQLVTAIGCSVTNAAEVTR